jgi:hypothetical protein
MLDPLLVDVYPEDVDGKPNWPALVAAGPPWHGAIIKVSDGVGGAAPWQVDLKAWFCKQWPAIREAAGPRYGVDFFRGGYAYLQIGLDGAKQADHYLQRIEAAGGWGDGDLWPIDDVEEDQNEMHGKQETIDTTTLFAETVRARTGRGVMLYGGSWIVDLEICDKMGCSWLWRPRYTATLPPESYEAMGWTRDEVVAWQYASEHGGKLAGYPMTSPIGATDLSAVIIAGGGENALEWLRTHLRSTPDRPPRDLTLQSPNLSGEDVREVQDELMALGYTLGKPDGIYGNQTASAVRRFQSDHALKPDGIVDPRTRAALAIAGNG